MTTEENIGEGKDLGGDAPAANSTHAPWAIKSIAKEASSAALTAAKRNRMSVGAWLELAIRARIQWEQDGERLLAQRENEITANVAKLLLTKLHAMMGDE